MARGRRLYPPSIEVAQARRLAQAHAAGADRRRPRSRARRPSRPCQSSGFSRPTTWTAPPSVSSRRPISVSSRARPRPSAGRPSRRSACSAHGRRAAPWAARPARRRRRTSAPDCRGRTGARRWKSCQRPRSAPRVVTRASMSRPSSAAATSLSSASRSLRKARSSGMVSGRTVSPAAMAWPPPASSRPCVVGRLHGAAQVHARLRAARALADVGGAVDADHHHRLAVAFAQAAGDDADHAGMPAVGGHQQQRRVGLVALALDDGGPPPPAPRARPPCARRSARRARRPGRRPPRDRRWTAGARPGRSGRCARRR